MNGIHAWGTYLPRYRMQRELIAGQTGWLDPTFGAAAIGRRSVANWDEDALTLAVAAGRRALDNAGPESCDALVFASTTAPFLDRSNAGLVAEALSLPDTIHRQDVGGSQRAATTAMQGVLDGTRPTTTLIVAADRRPALPGSLAEMRYGEAAAAVVVGPGEGVARYLGGRSLNRDFVHQYRTHEHPTDYVLEDRWVRDKGVLAAIPPTVIAAAEACGIEPAAIDHLIVPLPARHAARVSKQLGIPSASLRSDLAAQVGETGVAHPLLQLAYALESAEPDQVVCVTGFGQGCDVALFRTTAAIDRYRPIAPLADAMAGGIDIEPYLKLPVLSRQLRPDRGIRGEADKRTAMSVHYRRRREINAMTGSQCTACGTPHFPRARVCVACQAIDAMTDYGFAHRRGFLKTYTEDWQAGTPVSPLCYGNVRFEGGGNAFLELTDVEPGTLEIGMPLRMQFRIKDYDDQRGFRRYFWKPAPVHGTDHG